MEAAFRKPTGMHREHQREDPAQVQVQEQEERGRSVSLQTADTLQTLQDENQEKPPAAPMSRAEKRGIGQIEENKGCQRHDSGSQPTDGETHPAYSREER